MTQSPQQESPKSNTDKVGSSMPQAVFHSKLAQLQAAEAKLLVPTYERNPILFTRGKGVHLYDESNQQYLDLLSGIGVCALGYGHPAVTSAIQSQASELLHTSNLFFQIHTAELAVRLTEITGMDRAFFCNSGTEAWEAALKLARAHAALLRAEGRSVGTKILAVEHSFHGRTMGSVSTTHKAAYREPFNPLVPDVEFIAFNDVDALRRAFSNEVCAIAFEVIQGEGGVNPVSVAFLQSARDLCNQTGALLILDEIQSGMGRTGTWCAYQQFGVQPDVTTLAKPLANGVPIGAMLCTDEAARGFKPGMHGTTFGGNPLACAAAIAVVDALKTEKLLEHNARLGAYLLDRLQALRAKYPFVIKDVRGMGLMIGVELSSPDLAKAVLSGMLKRHIVINRTHETVLRLLPPYLIQEAHADQFLAVLDELLTEAAAHHLPTPESDGAPAPEETVHG